MNKRDQEELKAIANQLSAAMSRTNAVGKAVIDLADLRKIVDSIDRVCADESPDKCRNCKSMKGQVRKLEDKIESLKEKLREYAEIPALHL